MLCYTKIMINTLSKELKQLNNIFKNSNTKLFIVGGFVRDNLLNLTPTDVDLPSKLTNDKLFELLKNTNFKVKLSSNKLGTTIITKNNKSFEHTTFRKESYVKGGFHSPSKVKFVKNLVQDAKRRDFTINSMYYDLQKQKVIDVFNGKKHLRKRVVKAIITPDYVFSNDGLRILRMVRLSAELDFKINKKTFKVSKKMTSQLGDISKERIFAEFELLLNANYKYGLTKQNGINYLVKLNALKYIFTHLQVLQNKVNLKKFANNLFYFKNVSKSYKLQAFILDLSLYLSKQLNEDASKITTKLLTAKTCALSNKKVKITINLIKAYEKSLNIKTNNKARRLLQDYNLVTQPLFELLNNNKDIKALNILKKNYYFMKKHNIPFSLEQLNVNGTLLKQEFNTVKPKQIGQMLNLALKFCVKNKNNNTKTNILSFLKNKYKKEDKK